MLWTMATSLLSRHGTRGTYHFYNKLLIGADVLGRAVRVIVLVLWVPYLTRVRPLEGDSWTQKSQGRTRGEEWRSEPAGAYGNIRGTHRPRRHNGGRRESAMAEGPAGVSASASPSRLNGRRYVSIRVGREIAKVRRPRHRSRSYLPYRYSSAMAIGLLSMDSRQRDAWMCARGDGGGRVRAVRGDGAERESDAARATVAVLLREGTVAARAGRHTSA